MKKFDLEHIRAALKDNLADIEMINYIVHCVEVAQIVEKPADGEHTNKEE